MQQIGRVEGLVEAHLLLPLVMSFTNRLEFVYRAGLTHPTDPFPEAMRAALIFESKPAMTGVEAEVPETPCNKPPI